MKKITLLLSLLLLSAQLFAKGYVFFFHNKFLELFPLSEAHPEYGKVEYYQIIDAFKKEHFTVFSEIREKGADVKFYARKAVKQIDSLLARGVKPGEITVVGTSKGGYIAQYVSTYLKNEHVNFVFIGSCGTESPDELKDPDINFCGNILSVFEKGDSIGQSCERMKNKSKGKVTRFKEIEINTGLKHGYLYKAMPVWLEPTINWAKQKYD